MDQATQTAALNADLLVELLSHSSGPQKRESTAANLLPANGEHYAQVRYHLSCTGCKPLSCIGHAPSLTHRSRTIFPAQLTHHLSCTGHAPSLMHKSHTIPHAYWFQSMCHTEHLPACTERAISTVYYYTCISAEDMHTSQSSGTVCAPAKHINLLMLH